MLRILSLSIVLLALLSSSGCRLGEPEYEATGFYRLEQSETRWWLVDPEGYIFYSVGLNHIRSSGYTDKDTGRCPYCETIADKYGSAEAWRIATAKRLHKWGFNTIGSWSDREGFDQQLAHTPIVSMGGGIDDYFSTALEQQAASVAASQVAPYRDDPNILGWLTGNEMHWGPDWRGKKTLLEEYLELPEQAPGRVVAETFIGDPDGFLLALASRYFQVTTEAIRAVDPNHLLLGVRASTIGTPPQIPEAAGPWLDLFSVNHYDLPENYAPTVYKMHKPTPVEGGLRRYHELSGLPLMITEFTYRSSESDVPNSFPPIYFLYETQEERSEAYRRFALKCFDSNYIVGHHWFEYYDDPPGGRSDGEDSNFGIVNNDDEPYQWMTFGMSFTNSEAPHRPLGKTRQLAQVDAPITIQVGEIYGDHYVESIEMDPAVPPGIYTFHISDPDSGSIELRKDGIAVSTLDYWTRYHLFSGGGYYPFIFPGYFQITILAKPGPYTYTTTYSVYNTIFDGLRTLQVIE